MRKGTQSARETVIPRCGCLMYVVMDNALLSGHGLSLGVAEAFSRKNVA